MQFLTAVSCYTLMTQSFSLLMEMPWGSRRNEELITLNNWKHKNFLFLNKRKTEVVIFGTDARISQVSSFKVYIGNYELTRVSESLST